MNPEMINFLWIYLIIVIIFLIWIFLLPSFIAIINWHKRKGTIIFLNIIIWWTGIWWIICLVYALKINEQNIIINNYIKENDNENIEKENKILKEKILILENNKNNNKIELSIEEMRKKYWPK